MNTKRCSKCRLVKPLTDFARNRSRSDGHAHYCKSCSKEHKRTIRNNAGVIPRGTPRTHCRHGHEFTEANTYIHPGTGYRTCITCRRASQRRRVRSPEQVVARQAQSETWRFKRYGITTEEQEALFTAQGGLCAICHLPETARKRNGSPKKLSVDHDHITGRVRGLLCLRCNTAIGKFKDDPERLRSAILYLEKKQKPKYEAC